MADIGKKVKEAATKAEDTKDSESGVDKAERALKNRLK